MTVIDIDAVFNSSEGVQAYNLALERYDGHVSIKTILSDFAHDIIAAHEAVKRDGVEHVTIVLSEIGSGDYFVESPQLPGCMSGGDTKEEALLSFADALTVWVGAQIERGWKL